MITFVVCFLLLDNFNYGAEKKNIRSSSSIYVCCSCSFFVYIYCLSLCVFFSSV